MPSFYDYFRENMESLGRCQSSGRSLSTMCLSGMKDHLLLLPSAAVLALTSWGFWHYFDEDALPLLLSGMLLLTAIDNHRLRRAIKQINKRHAS